MEELKNYIENNVFKEYEKNEKGHGVEHIKNVIKRSFEISTNLDVDKRFVLVIAAYHDIGHHIDRNKHEIISAEIFMNDKFMENYFSLAERIVIKEAIEDHRASAKSEPRSIYGKIVADADRTISLDVSLKRTYEYSKFHYKEMSQEEVLEEAYRHIEEKFGENGYIKLYFNDEKNLAALAEIRNVLKDKDEFYRRLKKVNNL